MNLDQLLRDSAPDSDEMHRETRRMRTRVVAQFQAREVQRPHHRGRWAAGVLAAAAAATAYVVVSPGGPAVSPAYAIDQQADGDVVVTIHRLEDADGLEAALQEHGIDAEVSFNPSDDGTFWMGAPDGGSGDLPPEGGTRNGHEREFNYARPTIPDEAPGDIGCGMGSGEPATLTQEGDDWVLLIPAESPLQDRPVSITTGVGGTLGAAYQGNDPGTFCALVSTSS